MGEQPVIGPADRRTVSAPFYWFHEPSLRPHFKAYPPAWQAVPFRNSSAPVLCTPHTPWGIHSIMVDRQCSRCGWCG